MYDVDIPGFLTSNVARKNIEGVRQYVRFISPSALDHLGMSALHYGALGGDPDIMCTLLNVRCDVNVRNSHGNTPLHVAAAKGYEHIIAQLISGGADITLQNSSGKTAAEVLKATRERERSNICQ